MLTDEGVYVAVAAGYDSAKVAVAELLGGTAVGGPSHPEDDHGINRVAGAFEWDEGDDVVRTDHEHFSGMLPWRRLE